MIETDKLKNVQPVADFDWDAYEKGDLYTNESREKLVETYDQSLNKVNYKEFVMGKVTAMKKS